MPAVDTVAAGIGGDDALNADLLGSLRDTVRHRDFSRHPSDCKSPVNVTTVAPDVPIPAPTRASPSRADNPNRSHARRACTTSHRSLTSSRNTRVCRKTTQVRCERTTRDARAFSVPSRPRHVGAPRSRSGLRRVVVPAATGGDARLVRSPSSASRPRAEGPNPFASPDAPLTAPSSPSRFVSTRRAVRHGRGRDK
jgi:hypothetical protein